MKRRLVILASVCAIALSSVLVGLAAPQKPANVAGTWQLVLNGMQSRAMSLALTQNGTSLKGTLGPSNAKGGAPITGNVDGNKVSFVFEVSKPKGPSMAQKYSGTVNGDSMTGSVEVIYKGFTGLQSFMNMDRYVPWTAKRQK